MSLDSASWLPRLMPLMLIVLKSCFLLENCCPLLCVHVLVWNVCGVAFVYIGEECCFKTSRCNNNPNAGLRNNC